MNTDGFESRSYRKLRYTGRKEPWNDGVRHFLLMALPNLMTWTPKEKTQNPRTFTKSVMPMVPSDLVEKLARFIVAMTGALFILVPMYIMALHQSQTNNLVTTTVAVVLFALTSSIMLRTTNDQTLAVTAGYAAVLMVFVGLTSQPKQ